MAGKNSAQDLQKLRKEFQEAAGKGFDQMFGTDGQNGLVSFTEREERAGQVGDDLTRWLLEEHLANDPAADPGEWTLCPLCAAQVPCEQPHEVELEKRKLQTRSGPLEFERAGRRCSQCRRVFFPPG